MLANFRYGFDFAVNGLQAIEAMRKTSCDLVLMDIQMPDLDGPAALRIVRDQDYLSKPLHADRLGEMLRRVAGGRPSA